MRIFDKPYYSLQIAEIAILSQYIYDLDNPKWKPIVIDGIDTGYQISNLGEIKGKKGNLLKKDITNTGYYRINGYFNKHPLKLTLHRLVAEYFIPNPENKPQVNHINGNKKFDWVGNLEWNTPKENTLHAVRTGLMNFKGNNHPENVYTEEQIRKACELLENSDYKISDITNITGINRSILYSIRMGRTWTHISSEYSIPKPKPLKINPSCRIIHKRKPRAMNDKTKFIYDSLNSGMDKKDIANILIEKFNATNYNLAMRSINKVNYKYIRNHE